MGRVVNPESAGKERKQLTIAIGFALRELAQQDEISTATRDLVAFIAISLQRVNLTIDSSVAPWEKRGYWVKADRFRLEWAWTEHLGKPLEKAILAEDWSEVARISAQIAEHIKNFKLPKSNRLGKPWEGAWEKIR